MKFIVTGIGRSGIKYTSALLTNAGITCSWEQAFKSNRHDISLLKTQGDASWFAAPFISELPKNTVILHQTKDPLEWLNSWLKVSPNWRFQFSNFIDDNCGFFRWKDGSHPSADMRLYVAWNEMIEKTALENNLTYLRYKLEDLDFRKIMEISALTRFKVSQIQAFNAVKNTNKKTNASKPLDTYVPVTWETLPQGPELTEFRIITEKYGYTIG